MPRRACLSLPGIPWHIIKRGNNRSACFYTDEDYEKWGQNTIVSNISENCVLTPLVFLCTWSSVKDFLSCLSEKDIVYDDEFMEGGVHHFGGSKGHEVKHYKCLKLCHAFNLALVYE